MANHRLSYFLGLDRESALSYDPANPRAQDLTFTDTLRNTSLPRLARAMQKLDARLTAIDQPEMPKTVAALLHAGEAPATADREHETLEITLFPHPQQPGLCAGVHVRDRFRVSGWPELRCSFAASEIGFGMAMLLTSSAIPEGERLALFAWRWGNVDVRERSLERVKQLASNRQNSDWMLRVLTASARMFQDFPHPVTDAVNSLRAAVWDVTGQAAA